MSEPVYGPIPQWNCRMCGMSGFGNDQALLEHVLREHADTKEHCPRRLMGEEQPPHAPCDTGDHSRDLGRKDDSSKLERFDLIPPKAEALVAAVLGYGAKKYAPYNWRKVDNWRDRYEAAFKRHVSKWKRGEKLDPEFGLPHLAHAVASLLFILELDE